MIAPRDGALHFRGVDPSHLVTTILDTEYLTVGVGEVLSGHVEEFAFVEDESVLYLLEGELWVDIWTELQGYSATGILSVGEAVFLPSGTQQRVLERSGRPARYVFGSARVPDDWSAGD